MRVEIGSDERSSLQEANNPQSGSGFRLGYRPWLDGLRGVAVLLVLAVHFQFLTGGFIGVDIFYVLSGFLITTLLMEEWQRRSSIDLKHFYLRRALRLLPAFLTLLLICGAWSFMVTHENAVALRKEMLVAGCYATNWPKLHQTPMPTLGHTWSLAMEEQFYILWPVLLYGLLRAGLPIRRIVLLIGLGIVSIIVHRNILYDSYRGDISWHDKWEHFIRLYSGFDTRADTLLVGCLLGLIASQNWLPKSRGFVFWSGLASLVSVAFLGYCVGYKDLGQANFYRLLFTIIALMVAIVIARLLAAPSRLGSLFLEFAPLVGIGRISYALYLFHIPIMGWVPHEGLGWKYPAATLTIATLTFAAAIASYYCIEKPCLGLKHRLVKSATASDQHISTRLVPCLHNPLVKAAA